MIHRVHLDRALAYVAIISLMSGCGWVALPDLYHPGPAGYQRARAIQHDPYPLDDVAEPVVGGRPREYQRPIPEPERAVQYDQRHAQAAGVAAPPVTIAPAPVVAAPFSVPPPPTAYGAAPVTPAPLTAPPPQPFPYAGAQAPITAPITTPAPAPYSYSAPATPVAPAPAPYPIGSPAPLSPSPVPQFRPPY